MKTYLLVGGAAIICASAIALNAVAGDNEGRPVMKAPFGQSKRGSGGGAPQILYHGGPVLTGIVPLYVIYYGSIDGFPGTSQPIINAFLGGLSQRPQYEVNATYCAASTCTNPATPSVSGMLSTGQIFYDPGSQGTNISSNDIPKIIQNALTAPGGFHAKSDAIYIVVTAPTIKVSGFCTSYCAFHTKSTTIVSGTTIHYALAPEPDSKCTVCDGNFATFGESATPNGDPGADEVVDSLMHEISETVTDPDLNAWFTSNGAENGDLCNFNYGTNLSTTSTGASYNASWNKFNYLIQLIWKNGPTQGCAAAPSSANP
jgi:hypothetical protein